MNIEINTNARKISEFIAEVAEKQIPFARLSMLSKLASQTRKSVYDEMDLQLELPLTRYTLQSMGVDPATRQTGPISKVYLKDDPMMRQEKALGHLFRGGNRRWKNMEGALLRKNMIPPGHYAVPGSGAKLDRYGNMTGAFIRSLLSYFEALNEGNMTAETRAEKSNKKKTKGYMKIHGVEYFISFGKGNTRNPLKNDISQKAFQHLPPGIYSRKGTHGSNISPILMFVPIKKPYRKYIDLPHIGRTVVAQKKDIYFNIAMRDAIATSRQMKKLAGEMGG